MKKITDNEQLISSVFKKGSKTYFNSSLFFPEKIRQKVFRLYAFVRVADDFVDSIPQNAEEFYAFQKMYIDFIQKKSAGRIAPDQKDLSYNAIIIEEYGKLFDELSKADYANWVNWTNSFLLSMQMDLEKSEYHTLAETKRYIYGSAEVIGLFMSSIMGLDQKSYIYARFLGRAMQYINFIRDIDEDNQLGRRYLPLQGSPLKSLKKENLMDKQREEFILFIRKEIRRYYRWQKIARKGYCYIPWRYLIPIKTAADMYLYTAKKIENNPFIVFDKKVKPSRLRILFTVFMNAFLLLFRFRKCAP